MKKLFAIILACAALLGTLACGGKSYDSLSIKSVSGFGESLLRGSKFDFTPEAIEDPTFAAERIGLDASQLTTTDGKLDLYAAVSASAPEAVFVISAIDAATAKSILEGPVSKWVADMKAGYSSYGPEQVPKLDSCVKMTAGHYVFLIVSSDNDAAKARLETLLDTALRVSD